MKESDLKKLLLELEGKGLTIVFDDTDLELAAKSCIDGVLNNAGQRYNEVSAVFVQESIANEFVNKVLKHLDSWKVGDPRLDQITIGPLITE